MIDTTADEKMDAYVARIASLPKRDRREMSRASEQTKWIIEAMSEWYGFYHEKLSSLGISPENWINRLWEPRQQFMNVIPHIPDPPPRAAAVEIALRSVRESRRRVLLICERHSGMGIEYAAHRLRMPPNKVSKYLEEGRQSLADTLRGMGWKVPVNP